MRRCGSVTAAFAMGLRWAGAQVWGESRYRAAADRAYAALAKNISSDGELLGASGGTPVMPAAADYNAIPYAVTAFSQGLAMLALSLQYEINQEESLNRSTQRTQRGILVPPEAEKVILPLRTSRPSVQNASILTVS